MSDKIVSLRGDPIPLPGVADPFLVEQARKILLLAETGRIKGFAVALCHNDDTGSSQYFGYCNRNTVGHLISVANRLTQAIDNGP